MKGAETHKKVAIVGNPNVGKSVLFGFLTGRYVTVSNYPGTTVELASARTSFGGSRFLLVDTPGVNTLVPMSEDEQVTRDILLNDGIHGVLQVADTKNLRRALLISLQLVEMGIPFLLNLNMEDEAAERGIVIDKERLSRLLGVPVVGTVAIQKKGLKELKRGIVSLKPSLCDLTKRLPVEEIVSQVFRQETPSKKSWRDRVGSLLMHPFWGLVGVAAVLFLFYQFVGKFGAQTAVRWLEEGLFGHYINPGATILFSKIFFFSSFFKDLFVGPYGIITMALTYAFAIIFPIVLTFFLAFSLLEDSGYLPRLAVLLNRVFKTIGLNGKAVVPMVLGLGCDTMATMSARIMDTKKERVILTLLLALGVPCSAQLGIILAMLSRLPLWATGIWSVVVLGSILAVGYLAKRILPGERSGFVLEIPPIRRPTFFNIVTKTIARLEWYLKEVVPIFILGTLVLFFLDRFRALGRIEAFGQPLVVRFLGLPKEAAEAFLIGFLRRDYGATHFFELFQQGKIDSVQALVSLVVMTLFVPCLANTLMILKERGWKTALAMVAFIYPFAFAVGGVIHAGLRWGGL